MNIYHRFLGAAVGPPFFCSRELVVVSFCRDNIFQTQICADDVAGEYKNSVYLRQKIVLSGAWGLFIFFRLDAKENGTKRKDQGISSASRRRADAGFLFLPLFADE